MFNMSFYFCNARFHTPLTRYQGLFCFDFFIRHGRFS